jgi:hypothetical protein
VAKIEGKILIMALYEQWNIPSNLLFSTTIRAIKVKFANTIKSSLMNLWHPNQTKPNLDQSPQFFGNTKVGIN